MVRHIGGTAHAKDCHLWKDENPAQYKARKAAERQAAKERREMSLKRKFGHLDNDDDEEEEDE